MHVFFRLGDHRYIADLEAIREVVRGVELDVVPGTPEPIRGILNLRGVPVPVTDLRLPPYDGHGDVLVLVGQRVRVLGVAVDQVLRVSGLDDLTVATELALGLPPFVRGVARPIGQADADPQYLVDLRMMVDVLTGGPTRRAAAQTAAEPVGSPA